MHFSVFSCRQVVHLIHHQAATPKLSLALLSYFELQSCNQLQQAVSDSLHNIVMQNHHMHNLKITVVLHIDIRGLLEADCVLVFFLLYRVRLQTDCGSLLLCHSVNRVRVCAGRPQSNAVHESFFLKK